MLGLYFVVAYIVVALIGFYFVAKSGPKKRTPYKPKYKGTTFTVPESGTYKVSGTVTTQDMETVEYFEGRGTYIVPRGSTPVLCDKGPAGRVYYKPNTNQIIDGNDLVLLGDL